MTSFTDSFPDNAILQVLGDDITHIKPGGGSVELKGVFEFKYLEDELGDQIDIIYPVVELNNVDAVDVGKQSRIVAGGTVYKLLKKRPHKAGKTQLILRTI